MSAPAAVARRSFPLGATIATELELLAGTLRRVTVRIHGGAGRFDAVGAGILWPSEGVPLVLTNAHVVPPRQGDTPRVQSSSGQSARSRVIARNREVDLALLELIDVPEELTVAATIGRAQDLRVGEIVVALGHPFGVDGALSVGVVNAMPNDDDEWLRADVRLAPGNSGGPLATLDGAVIGVNSMIVGGLGIAVPSQVAERFAREVFSPR